ncbi:MAG: ATP-binding protein [Thermoproteota archaeon]
MKLRVKFAVVFLVLLVYFGCINLYIAYKHLTETVRDNVIRSSISLAQTFRDEVVDLILSGNKLQLRFRVKEFIDSNPQVAYVYVVGPTGEVLASSFGDGVPASLLGFNKPGLQGVSVSSFRSGGEIYHDISLPALMGAGGEIHVGIRESYVSGIVGRTVRSMAVLGVLVATSGSLAVYLSFRGLTNPMQSLLDGIVKMAQGMRGVRVPHHGDDEIAVLAKAFNTMAERIEESERRVKLYLEELRSTAERMRSLKALYLALLNSMEDGVVLLDRDDTVVFANSAAKGMVGEEELKYIVERFKAHSQDLNSRKLVEEVSITSSARRRVLSVKAVVPQGVEDKRMLILRDVTSEKEAEELRHRMMELRYMLAIAALYASIAHRVNNALASIILYTERLKQSIEDAEGKMLVDSIAREADKIAAFFKTIRERLNPTTPFEEKVFRVDDIIDDVVSEFNLAERSIELVRSRCTQCTVKGDPTTLRIALSELVKNAVEAMPGGGLLEIVARRVGDTVRIDIRDTGAGIPGTELSKVVEPFYTSKRAGLGLGLPIAATIIRMHGGTIHLRNRDGGRGAEAIITLPGV